MPLESPQKRDVQQTGFLPAQAMCGQMLLIAENAAHELTEQARRKARDIGGCTKIAVRKQLKEAAQIAVNNLREVRKKREVLLRESGNGSTEAELYKAIQNLGVSLLGVYKEPMNNAHEIRSKVTEMLRYIPLF